MKNIDAKSLSAALSSSMHALRPYVGLLVFMLFAGVYGFLVFKVNSLADPTIEQSAVTAEIKSLPTPKIDEDAARKLSSLKDNSVNVQALFEQSRTNPFQE